MHFYLYIYASFMSSHDLTAHFPFEHRIMSIIWMEQLLKPSVTAGYCSLFPSLPNMNKLL